MPEDSPDDTQNPFEGVHVDPKDMLIASYLASLASRRTEAEAAADDREQ